MTPVGKETATAVFRLGMFQQTDHIKYYFIGNVFLQVK